MADSHAEQLPVVLFHYPYSPYAKRVVWYLRLRGIPYFQCLQPPIMPRPDIAQLGIKYRRIPILSIGRDVYLDTRLIIQKLELLYPGRPKLGAAAGTEHKAIERLLEAYAIDGGLFVRAAQLLPTDLPLLRDPRFQKDRADYFGAKVSREAAAALRPEAVNEVRNSMELLETTLLADGRDWILKTAQPSLADIEAVWPLHWLNSLPGALPADQVSAEQFPRVFAWISRFHKATKEQPAPAIPPKAVSGEEARRLILESPFHEPEMDVDCSDPAAQFHGLSRGRQVELWPTDSGTAHRDTGRLSGLGDKEVVVETDAGVRLHAPRHGFRLRPADQTASL
ncbi:glutathione S-transferase [Lasiosphaeria miniovina]|uniref:Glutathione S-transferase n=1 Tax=Lasiosphaeria miniovina TaxID=1954250 RepID=A0AA40B6E8_9PEZI|nr:glutathione S-transferase [Lasiosphaeria miniovina]KAK0728579.1 glutathione S-transferase [Lasiosphaeria miniovina]